MNVRLLVVGIIVIFTVGMMVGLILKLILKLIRKLIRKNKDTIKERFAQEGQSERKNTMNGDFNENKIVNEEGMAAEAAADMAAAAVAVPVKKGIKKGIIALVALGVAVIASVTTLVVANTPAALAKRAMDKVVKDFSAREEITYFTSLLSGGSVDVAVDGEVDGVDLNVGGKLYINAKDREMMFDNLNFKMEMDDEKRELTGSFYASDKEMYVTNEEFLKGTYGIARGSFVEGIEDSVLNPENDSEFALDEKTYEILLSVCEIADSELPEDLEKDLTEVLERYSKALEKSISKHAQFEKKTEKLKLHDGEKNVRVIYIIITPETIANVMQDMYDYIEADKELRELVIKYYDSLAGLLESAGYADEDFDIEDEYDELIENLGEMVEKAIESIEDKADDEFVALCIATPKSSVKTLKMWALAGEDVEDIDDEDEVTEIFYVDFGEEGVKDTQEIVIKIHGVEEKLKYIINTEKKNVTEYKLQMGSIFKASVTLDRKEEKFKISVTAEDSTYGIEGKYTTKGDAATFELKKVKVNGEALEDFDFDVVVTLDKSDKMPSPEKKYTSVFELTEEDIEDIQERMIEWGGFATAAPEEPEGGH